MRRYRISIVDTNESYYCVDTKHLLEGMVALGKKGIPSGCHGGGCGICKVKVISGEYKKLSMSNKYISKNEYENNIVLACRIIPQSDLRLKVIRKVVKSVLNGSFKNME